MLTKFRASKKVKRRELALTVRAGSRLNATQADHIFDVVSAAIQSNLDVGRWIGPAQEIPQGRYRIWSSESGGRKVVRPVVEQAVRDWEMML